MKVSFGRKFMAQVALVGFILGLDFMLMLLVVNNYQEYRNPIWFIIPTMIACICCIPVAYSWRSNKREERTQFRLKLNHRKMSVKSDFKEVVKSKAFSYEIKSYVIIAIIACIIICIKAHIHSLPGAISAILILVLSVVFFALGDLLVWIMVHKAWTKNFIPATEKEMSYVENSKL